MKLAKTNKIKQRPPGKGKTTVTPVKGELLGAEQLVKIYHLQGIKQSTGYQSGDVAYSVEIYAKDDPKSIQAAIERAEQIVEDALGDKLPQMTQVLQGLAKLNGK